MNHKKGSIIIFILAMLSVPFADANERQSKLQDAQSQKESTLKLLDEEATLFNETMDELRENHQTNQTPPQISSGSAVGLKLERLASGFKTTLLDLL